MEPDMKTRMGMLGRAIEAVRAYLEAGPRGDLDEINRLAGRASTAVTTAVTEGGWLHTQIATPAGCTGLRVIELITDWSAQARAIRVERKAIKNYEEQVREAARLHALRRVGAQGYGAKSQIHREIGVTRAVVNEWIARAKAEQEAMYRD